MTVVVVYESMYGNTHLIAKAFQHHGFQMLTQPESVLVTTDNQLLPAEGGRARQGGSALTALL